MPPKKRQRTQKNIQISSHGFDYQTVLYINPNSANNEYINHYVNVDKHFIIDTEYEGISESIIREVKSKKLCKDILDKGNIKRSLDNADFILTKVEMAVNSAGEIQQKIVGFSTGRIIYTNKIAVSAVSSSLSSASSSTPKIGIYVDILCGHSKFKGVGTSLMTEMKQLGKDILAKTIHLSSVTESLGFYLNLGLECDPLCKMKWKI